ncbi:MAG: proprotein convertase P-domain-containing protein [Deltaproteobacteria bacterium]|nr:proprotein convertase P-domain-containing protein [Deltaproteobacteria bacterium]
MKTQMRSALAASLVALTMAACHISDDGRSLYEGPNPFLDPSGGKEDTGYVNTRGVELHVSLEADIIAPAYRIFDAPAELAQFAVTYLRDQQRFYLEILAEDATAADRVEWLVDGEWLTKEQARSVDASELKHFRMREVNAVLLDAAARSIQAGKIYQARVPIKPLSIMSDAADGCAAPDSHIELDQSVYWYLWSPDRSSCPAELVQTMSVTVDEVLENNPSSYPEYDRLWADGELSAVVLFGRLDHDGDVKDDYNWQSADKFCQWLVEAGFAEADSAPLGRRFVKKAGEERSELVDVYYPDVFENVADYSRFRNWQKAVSEHEVILYNGHSVLGTGYAFERAEYPPSYQIFQVASCLSYEYYVRPVLAGKGGWESVDVIANVEPTYYHENLPLCGAFLAKLFYGFENGGRASWQEILDAVHRRLGHGRFGVSGARGNCFSPEGDRCAQEPGPEPDPDELRFENADELPIPDDDAAGVASSIFVDSDVAVGGLSLEVEISHTYIADLRVVLEHDGVQAVVWDRLGGSGKDLFRAFEIDDFDGQVARGSWTLRVSDCAGIDTGSLDRWSLVISPAGRDNDALVFEAGDADIPDDDQGGVSLSVEVPAGKTVESIAVSLDISHTYVGDLEIHLSHAGMDAPLWAREGGGDDDIHQTFRPDAFRGQDAGGTWTLSVVDHARLDAGRIDSFVLEINPD